MISTAIIIGCILISVSLGYDIQNSLNSLYVLIIICIIFDIIKIFRKVLIKIIKFDINGLNK